ncbi:MAG TPA: tetratricopeptide repeat protein [Anaeromyxobacteraceae bacterium]|nr:tetratricopeptide repeat protein [Anaeromyxobacteraceae bacterium]
MRKPATSILVHVALAIAVVAVYARVLGSDFVNFDDNIYVYQNPWVQRGFTLDSVAWAFGFAHKHDTYWQPLTWLSLMADFEAFGLRPAGYHCINLLLHVASASLLFAALRRMTGRLWPSAFVVALFALHPVNVESVAWIAERKNVLSAFFWMLALYTYVRWVEDRSWLRYLATFVAMALGLMAKTMLVSLPFALLLLDFWPLSRWPRSDGGAPRGRPAPTVGSLLLEKLPLMALSALSVAVTLYSLGNGKHGGPPAVPLLARTSEALVSYVRYLGKLVWPTHLAVYYPSRIGYSALEVGGSALGLAAATAGAIALRRRAPWFLTGWLWYVVVLLPVSGLVRGGLWPALADRFAYLPGIGIFVVAGFGGAAAAERGRIPGRAAAALAMAVLCALSVLTWKQVGYWQDSIALFTHAAEVVGENVTIYDNLANATARAGREGEAVRYLERALAIDPSDRVANANLADALRRAGRIEEAIARYRVALRQEGPDDAMVHSNLGVALMTAGKLDEAESHFRSALAVDPGYVAAHYDLGVLFATEGRDPEAVVEYREAVRLQGGFADARTNLGMSLARLGRWEAAIAEFDGALRTNPGDALAHYARGAALEKLGRVQEAIAEMREALRLDPGDADAARDLGRLTGTQR